MKLEPADAIVALSYVMPDAPIRTLAETVLRLYENGYSLHAPEAAGRVRPFVNETNWRTESTSNISNQDAAKNIAPLPFHTKHPANVYGDTNHLCNCTEYDGHESYPYRETIR